MLQKLINKIPNGNKADKLIKEIFQENISAIIKAPAPATSKAIL